MMDIYDAHTWLLRVLDDFSELFQKLPGSAIFLRYVKNSYQDDPVRSGIELFLCLFALRYLLAPAYSTQKKSYVKLSEQVRAHPVDRAVSATHACQEIDELVEDWTPEPLVTPSTAFEEAEIEKKPVIAGWVNESSLAVFSKRET